MLYWLYLQCMRTVCPGWKKTGAGDEGNEKLVRAYDKKMQGLRDFPIGADFMG